ncbi:unnamed protein product [Prorocentrum cordatum]|uniref:Uncharacterized protein n=1 Tax=Prorocentrum cordatum TaxID=2364126 RepID=A0ABN9T854_9DINO|nr:unnamed protein product [Polarella glacialis]
MAWSSRRDGLYCQGWHCDNFAACGSSCASRGPHRWHCPGCCADVCGACAHVPGAPPPGGPEELGPPVVSRMAPARRQNPRAAVPSPTPRPGGLTLVAPCPEFGVQPEPPDGPAPSSAEEPAQEEGAYFPAFSLTGPGTCWLPQATLHRPACSACGRSGAGYRRGGGIRRRLVAGGASRNSEPSQPVRSGVPDGADSYGVACSHKQ